MSLTPMKMGVKKVNNAKPKTIPVPWYDFENPKGKEIWDDTSEEKRDTLTITYSRERYVPLLERQMRKKMEEGLPGGMLASMLAKVIMDWEVYHFNYDEDGNVNTEDKTPLILTAREEFPDEGELVFQVGEKIPVTPRILDQLINIAAQAKLVEALTEDNRPNATKSNSSNNTF